MARPLLILLLLFCLIPTKAFHIVGGEIEFIYLGNGLYRINVVQYFDEAQNQNPGPEAAITVNIFRHSDDASMLSQLLTLTTQEFVEYTNVECTIASLSTSRVVWSADVTMDPAEYADPEGYYIVWERCCRNTTIRNIVNPGLTGMKYVLDIPPLMKDGGIFVNSSPILFKPLSDYACIDQQYYIEFTGTDPDGDSLVYSLTTPYNSSSGVAVPIPTPKPHGNVFFNPGFSEENMIPGSRPLAITDKGLLTVTPSEIGLYVFSVLVEEYRDSEKIGQTRRDFQMLVIDGCNPPDPPVVDIDIPGDPDFNPVGDILNYTVAEAKCFDFLVANITNGETITLRAEGVNFDEELNDIFSLNQIPVDEDESQLIVEVCIPDCPPTSDGFFILDLIAGDDACPLPQLDTVRLTINVEPPSNIFPTYTNTENFVSEVEDNDPIYTQLVSGDDPDGHEMSMFLFMEGVDDPSLFGFDLDTLSSTPGNIQGRFIWDTDCSKYDFSNSQEFRVGIVIDDIDECTEPNPDTLFINTEVILPPNTDPIVSTNTAVPNQVDLGTVLDFDVSVFDNDGDDVTLTFIGGNFNTSFYDIVFEESQGTASSTSNFSWDLACNANLFTEGQEFELLFIGDDDDKCKIKNFDTLSVTVQVNYPPNEKPDFESISRNQVIKVNEKVQIEIEAFDVDNDEVTISFAEGIRQPASDHLVFESATGTGRVSSIFEWQPECSLLRFGENSTFQDVIFQVRDNACPISNIDTLKITFEIIDDKERQKEFLPPNVFTPNGDGVNDYFSLNGNADTNQNLPANNCDNSFEYIVINNRAGNSVFRSENRDFVWSGDQFPTGVYYYLIKYTNTEFKGFIHLLR